MVVLLSASCGGSGPQGTLTVAFDRVPTSLDPQHHNEVVGWSLLCNFYDALTRFTPEMRIEPSLAVSWRQVDATHIRLTLRKGVTFSSGEPFTAADVVASFTRALRDPASRIRHHLVGVQRMIAEDDATLVIETAAPAPTLINRLAFLFVLPRSQAEQGEVRTPIGTGPYRFLKREADGTVLAEGWQSWRGAPAVPRVRFVFVEDDNRRYARFAGGSLDVAENLRYDRVGDLQKMSGLRVKLQPTLVVHLLVVNARAATGVAGRVLADSRARHALLLAIDRAGLANRGLRGNGTVATQFVHPLVFGFDPSLAPAPFDPEAARRLLAAAGAPDGFAVDLAHGWLPPAYLDGIVQDLARIGVRAKPAQFPLRELLRRARDGEFPLLLYGRACTTGDASEILDSSIHSSDTAHGFGLENFSSFSDPDTDAMLEAADRELDSSRRLELLQRAQRRVLDQLPLLPLTLRSELLGTASRVDLSARFDDWLWVFAFRWER
jgi:peptide/nickel transport system substrate-binding protein